MKYTRYDLKRKNTDGIRFAAVFVGILILAFLIGSIVSRIVYRNDKPDTVNSVDTSKTNDKGNDKTAVNGGTVKFIALQGGMYKTKEYEDSMKNKLTEFGNPFVISEQDKGTRVLLGIFTEEEAGKRVKELGDKNLSPSKMTFEVNNNSECMAEISAIIDANLKVLTALMDKTAQSYKTEALKNYCANQKAVDKSSANYNELNELKEYIKNLPPELTKEKAAENYVFIYNILKKVTNK